MSVVSLPGVRSDTAMLTIAGGVSGARKGFDGSTAPLTYAGRAPNQAPACQLPTLLVPPLCASDKGSVHFRASGRDGTLQC